MKISEFNDDNFKSDSLALKEAVKNLKKWLIYLLSKWMIIISFIFLGFAIGYFSEYSAKPLYEASINFVIENSGSTSSSQLGNISSQFGVDLGGGSSGSIFSGGNLKDLFVSRRMIQEAFLSEISIEGEKISLIEYYIRFKGLREQWISTKFESIRFPPKSDPALFSKEQNEVVKKIHSDIWKKDLTININNTGISSIKVSSENELFCKFFVEALLNVVSNFYVETKSKKALENYAILSGKADSLSNVLKSGILNSAVFSDSNPNANKARSRIGVNLQRNQIDVEVNRLLYVQMIQNLESAKISLIKEAPFFQVIDYPVFPLDVTIPDKKKSAYSGAFIAFVLSVIFLVSFKILKDLLNE
jgi:hypothetical protein